MYTLTTMISMTLEATFGVTFMACCIVKLAKSKIQTPPKIWQRCSKMPSSKTAKVAWKI